MKKQITIFGAIIFASYILSSCNSTNQERKENSSKDSIEAARILQAKSDSLVKQNSADSLNKINYINEVLGEYTSNEGYKPDDLRDDEEQARDPLPKEAFETVTIQKKNNQIIINQSYRSDPGPSEGCDGSYYLKANAEVLDIEKLEESVYQLQLKKIDCNYYTGDFSCYGETINIKENTPKSNSDFSIIIDKKKNNKIKIKASVEKTKCIGAWDFTKYTFFKK